MAELPKIIVFDFDGVIIESADIKTRAFRQLFSDYPDYVEAIVAYHENNVGISRFEKFRYIYTTFLSKSLSNPEEQALGIKFSELVLEEVLQCRYVPGALEFLRDYCSQYPFYVASGTPDDELKQIVKVRRLAKFFQGVYGSPMKKPAILENIMKSLSMPPSSILFVGDGMSDYEAAYKTGIGFVGRCGNGQQNPFAGLNIPIVNDLFGLDLFLKKFIK